MTGQFLDDAVEVGAKAVADDGVRRLELEPGDEIGVDRNDKVERPAERPGEGVAAGLRLLGVSARAAVSRGLPSPPIPSRLALGERRERLGETVDEAVDAGRIGQARDQLAGDVDREFAGPVGAAAAASAARRRAFPPRPRRAAVRPRRGRRRARRRAGSPRPPRPAAEPRPARRRFSRLPPRRPRAPRSPASSPPPHRREASPPPRAAPR